MNNQLVYSVTDFVAICNQVLDTSFGFIQVIGEIANYKISRNKWVYFDLKDQYSSLRFFGSAFNLPGELDDGMMVVASGLPQLHPKFGFSVNFHNIILSGEGSIQKSKSLLEQKLAKEGLFDEVRKRKLPIIPSKVAIISSSESAGFTDFTKIVNERWSGLDIILCDVSVQGDNSPSQIIRAIDYVNQHYQDVEVLVITRGGGSNDDLQSFNHEGVVRAIIASRIPTLVAIGHEVDISLAERVADKRASTPSNAAQVLVPDKKHVLQNITTQQEYLRDYLQRMLESSKTHIIDRELVIQEAVMNRIYKAKDYLDTAMDTIQILDPIQTLDRGFVIVRQNGKIISKSSQLATRLPISLQFSDGIINFAPKEE